jgi:FKBP-type peptidyl-prolyl cis-trans isomerase FkpA
MNKVYKFFLIIVIGFTVTNCSTSNNDPTSVVLNDFTVQRDADDAKIVTYLKTHKINLPVVNFEVTFTKVSELDAECIWVKNQLPSATYPLLKRTCISNNIKYTIYYIKLQQGGASTPKTKKPCNLDGVFTAYKGRLMDDYVPIGTLVNGVATTVATGGASANDVGTVFDSNDNPTDYFNLDAVIRGWSEVFPLFNSGSYVANSDGTNTYSDFGAGVMFIPSGLAYFNGAPGVIPSYSPLIFNFKLYEVRRNDHDFDGIEDYNENLDGEQFADTGNTMKGSYIYTTAASVLTAAELLLDDTDADGIPDAYDQDDDNDRYPTRNECKRPDAISGYLKYTSGPNTGNYILDEKGNKIPIYVYDSNGVKINTGYYPFKGSVDNPATPYINEEYGVPRKQLGVLDPITNISSNPSDFTDDSRLRIYRDSNSHQ